MIPTRSTSKLLVIPQLLIQRNLQVKIDFTSWQYAPEINDQSQLSEAVFEVNSYVSLLACH